MCKKTTVPGQSKPWGGFDRIGRDSILGRERERTTLFFEKDDGNFHCQPWPECFKGDFLGKLGLKGKEARKGWQKKKR